MRTVDVQLAVEHGLSLAEYETVVSRLGRVPTLTELGIVSVMWSEHCSYKSSRLHLRKLPTTGPRVLQGPGENAGAIDIGGDWAAVFKMESHNHPSYIEPYQGAATGVGGILRDVFTMGARPVASLNSLRFGHPDAPRMRYLAGGVVAGIAGYGNCVGVPTVGGELYFDPSYNGNILVNVFNLGVCKHHQIFRAVARGVGNPVIYVGAKTGRDGIHGATMASAQFDKATEEKRPTVQVGDPFREKLLIEACLELMATGTVVAIQDMGAAGLTSSSVEMAGRGGLGFELDVEAVPRREPGMNAYECMLSESQERMLVVAHLGREDDVRAVFAKWDLDCAVVGQVTDTGCLVVKERGEVVVNLPVTLLTEDAPRYDRPTALPAYLAKLAPVDSAAVLPAELNAAVLALVASPNLCSRRPIFQQFDHMVGIGTVVLPGSDAAVIRIPGTDTAMAISVDCNSRYCYLDPFVGAQHAIAECARNLACVGAEPGGVTDCLNFGNPENPEIMWQLVRAIEGLAEGCRQLDVPVVSGNVSLYNETEGQSVFPTPTVGMVGVFPRAPKPEAVVTAGFSHAGDRVVLLGETKAELDGSEWARLQGALGQAPPALDWDRERAVQALVRRLVREPLVHSAHDLSEGGLLMALAESALHSKGGRLGVELSLEPVMLPALWLLSESASRVLVSIAPEDLGVLELWAQEASVPVTILGAVEADAFRWKGHFDVALTELRRAWEGGLDGII